jgi:hypothetical protein
MGLSGCDQVRTKLADLIAPQSSEDALKSVNTLVATGQLKEARAKAEAFVDKSGPLQAEFVFAAARVCALAGDRDAALRYLSSAIGPLSLTADGLMSESAFASLRTDIRFLQLITGQSAPVKPSAMVPAQSPAPLLGADVTSSGDAQIKMDRHSTEVRAGDIVIKLPN